MEILPEECVREIFTRLPVNDRLNVALVCKSWKRIAVQSWSNVRYVNGDWTSISWRTIATRTGRYLQNLVIRLPVLRALDAGNEDEESPFETLGLLAKHCTALERLGISWNMETVEMDKDLHRTIPFLSTIVAKNQHLRVVYLRYVELNHDFFKWLPVCIEEIYLHAYKRTMETSWTNVNLSRLVNLQALALFAFHIRPYQLEGIECLDKLRILMFDQSRVHPSNIEDIVNLKNLERLHISHCSVSDSELSQILQNNRNLIFLDISNIEGITNSTFQHIHKLKKLEELRMQNLKEVSSLAFMPQLRALNAYGCSSLTDGEIQKLFRNDSMINFINVSDCSVTVETLVIGYAYARCIKEKGELISLQVNEKIGRLWRRLKLGGYRRELSGNRFFIVSVYNPEMDNPDEDILPYEHWADFEYS